MSIDPLTGETWRFSVHENGSYMGEPVKVVARGRLYQLDSDWASDTWQRYWDGDWTVVAYDSRNYTSPTRADNPDETDRVEHALRMADEYCQDVDAMLTRLARRLASRESMVNWNARFISVGVERGVTLYALSWTGDPDGVWRDEVEAVYHGEVYRIETEEYQPGWACDHGVVDARWQTTDDMCDEWYGETGAQAAFEQEFPLAEFPSELFTLSSD